MANNVVDYSKLNLAVELVQKENLSIEEAAERCGVSSSILTEVFQMKQTGAIDMKKKQSSISLKEKLFDVKMRIVMCKNSAQKSSLLAEQTKIRRQLALAKIEEKGKQI